LVTTVHGSSLEDVKSKPILGELLEKKLFERYVVLNNIKQIGHLEAIYDSLGNRIYHQDY
jgi:stage III sporulation protein AA